MKPTSITLHAATGRIILHFPDRQLPLSHLPADEREVVLREIVERYNAGGRGADEA